jgi:hypothetical protein
MQRQFVLSAALACVFGGLTASAQSPATQAEVASSLPSVTWHEVGLVQLPGVENANYNMHEIDSNSPAFWNGDTFYMFNSYLHPWRYSGTDLSHLGSPVKVEMGPTNDRLWTWIESAWIDNDGTLYAAYHYEPDNLCFADHHLPTAPKIAWMRSLDNGATWTDLGFILAADPENIRCDTKSTWDAGGEGDFSFIVDREKEYIYFFFSSYDKDFKQQGIGVARMRYADRDSPAGKIRKWYNGAFSQPGIGGRFTPIFPAKKDWHEGHADLMWGPSIHWNTFLNTYAIVMNHAIDSDMTQEGIYATYNSDLSNPAGWSEPQRILDRDQILKASRGLRIDQSVGWYPEIVGTQWGESDKLCGQTGRFFMKGLSRLEIVFHKPNEASQ